MFLSDKSRLSICDQLRLALLAGFVVLAAPLADFHASPLATSAAQASDFSGASLRAADLAMRGNFSDATSAAMQSQDAATIKYVEFLYLKEQWNEAGYSRVMRFLEASPRWPLSETFQKNAERLLFVNRISPATVKAHFADRTPLTAEGQLALARAELALGNRGAAKSALMKAWVGGVLDAQIERQVIGEFGSVFSREDHSQRVWGLVLLQESNAAIRNAKRIGDQTLRAAQAAQLLLRFNGGGEKAYEALPDRMRDVAAMKYALARYYRKLEKFGKARAVLATISGDASTVINPEAIWIERRIVARRSLGPEMGGNWSTAYKIASSHGLLSGDAAIEAQFLAGWIAMQYLRDTPTALRHFEKLNSIATTRTDKARGTYWIGRAYAAQGDKKRADAAYREAAAFGTIYYGQLAREKIGLGEAPEKIMSGTASEDAIARVSRDEVVRAFQLADRSGNSSVLNLFLWSLASRFTSVEDMNAVAGIVQKAGGTPVALRFAKAAGQRGVDIDAWAYPTKAIPNWRQVGAPVEKSLVYALSRQESEFDTNAGSKVGAQGLMQLMPGTARLVARQYGLPFTPGKLKSDPVYNVRLGAAHLSDLVQSYDGSYILTLVAYNAGPRRVTEWIEQFGDPRSGKIDPIDWVESIPFQETRQYVQKVMQNVHVYRSRLAPETVRPMSADLGRGSRKIKFADNMPVGSVGPISCDGQSISALIKSCD